MDDQTTPSTARETALVVRYHGRPGQKSFRRISVIIDRDVVGTVAAGDEASFPVAPGEHELWLYGGSRLNARIAISPWMRWSPRSWNWSFASPVTRFTIAQGAPLAVVCESRRRQGWVACVAGVLYALFTVSCRTLLDHVAGRLPPYHSLWIRDGIAGIAAGVTVVFSPWIVYKRTSPNGTAIVFTISENEDRRP